MVGKSSVKHVLFLSFIDHSFEERRKNLNGKQREGSIINIKLIYSIYPLIQACKGTDILLELEHVKKIENFDNAAEFLLLKALFYKL